MLLVGEHRAEILPAIFSGEKILDQCGLIRLFVGRLGGLPRHRGRDAAFEQIPQDPRLAEPLVLPAPVGVGVGEALVVQEPELLEARQHVIHVVRTGRTALQLFAQLGKRLSAAG